MDRAHPLTPAAAVPRPRDVLELLKPVTWFPPMWAFMCGVVSSGVPLSDRIGFLVAGMLLAGPLVCGNSQAINDWFDRHVDASTSPKGRSHRGAFQGVGAFISPSAAPSCHSLSAR